MNDASVKGMIQEQLKDRLVRMGMDENDLTADLDLVRSGLLDSLAFIDLITALERAAERQLDMETALDDPNTTTVGGLIRLFS